MEIVHEIILKPDLSRFCVCYCIEESAPLFSLRARNLRFSTDVTLVSHRGGRSCGFPVLNGAFVTGVLRVPEALASASYVCPQHRFLRHLGFVLPRVQRLNVMDLDSYYHNRILRWAGHVARMPMTRAPRQLLTGWVAHSRPNGCPEMTWGRTLKKALKCKGLPANFKEWRAIAEDRSEWRKDEHCITQKDTQPSQTCSGGFINT